MICMPNNEDIMRKTIAAILLLVAIPANAISRDDLIDCLRGVPVDVICPN